MLPEPGMTAILVRWRSLFLTIGKAAKMLQPGDICFVREGHYRETITLRGSGSTGHPLRFEALRDQKVILDGTEALKGNWEHHDGNIYKIGVPKVFEQLFIDGEIILDR